MVQFQRKTVHVGSTPPPYLVFGGKTPDGFGTLQGRRPHRGNLGRYDTHEAVYGFRAGTPGMMTFPELISSNKPGKMTFVHFEPGNRDGVGKKAAGMIAAQLSEKPTSLMIMPTGETQRPAYQALREDGSIDFSQAEFRHLDEYRSQPGFNKENLFKTYMQQQLPPAAEARMKYIQDRLANLKSETAIKRAIKTYENEIEAAGGADLVMLGIGTNGHIAFIEPPLGLTPERYAAMSDAEKQAVTSQFLAKVTKADLTKLDDKTIRKNFGDSRVGSTDQAVTLGLRTILQSKKIILLALGEEKKAIVQKAFGDFNEPPTPAIPASFLKLHPDVTVITDF